MSNERSTDVSLSTVIKKVESFLYKVEQEFVKLFKESPTWIAMVGAFVTYVTPIAVTIVTLIDPPAGTATAAALATIKTTLAVLQAAAKDIANQVSIVGALESLQAEIPALLSALKVENPALVSKVESYANTILQEIEALLESVPASSTSITSTASSTSTAAAPATSAFPAVTANVVK